MDAANRGTEHKKNCHTLTKHTFAQWYSCEMKKNYRISKTEPMMVAVNRINFSVYLLEFFINIFYFFLSPVCGNGSWIKFYLFVDVCTILIEKTILSAALSRRHSFHFSTRNELETNLIDFVRCEIVLAVCAWARRRYVVRCHLVTYDGQRCHQLD